MSLVLPAERPTRRGLPLLLGGLALGLLGLGLAGDGADGSHSAGGEPARLRPLPGVPLRLSGSGFAAGERVRLTLASNSVKQVERVMADARGRFTVDFGLVAVDLCERPALVVRAEGARGSRATYKRLCPRPPHRQPRASLAAG